MVFSPFFLLLYILPRTILNVAQATPTESGQFTLNISDFRIVLPRKVSEEGKFLSHYLPHFYNVPARSKRDTSHLKSVHYILPLDEMEYHIELWPTREIFAPGLIVEHHKSDVKRNTSDISFSKLRSALCYYNGVIRELPSSRVALSTCDGLAGFIKIGKEYFLIEPKEGGNIPSEDERQEHVFYRNTRSNDPFFSNCGTSGSSKQAWAERMQWEFIHGRTIEKTMKNNFNENKSHTLYKKDDKFTSENENWSNICPQDNLHCPADKDLFIELMVAVDFSVDRPTRVFDMEEYLLTVINMVATNFHDGSIGRPIHIKLVRIIYLSYPYEELDVQKNSPENLLKKFCDWQMNFNPKLEEHPNHHDFAVFITQFQPCEGNILGITNIASICRPDKACAVVSDVGLLLGNIITHQIGHSLGAEHDEDSSDTCASEEPDGTKYHMGPVISTSTTEWSSCSRQHITQFLMNHASWCLQDFPTGHDFSEPTLLAGQVYSASQQCSINFNMKTVACLVGDFCKKLFCQISNNQCASTDDPPSMGTPCGPNMWCFNGNCVQRGSRPGAVNGEWGSWSPWSPCTRSCGGGVQSTHRSCNNPPPSKGGNYCPGKWIRHRMCSINRCEGFSQRFAQIQCRMTNDRLYKGHYYSWDYYRTIFEQATCALICINEYKEIAVRSSIVMDGTPCKAGTRDVCIRGACEKVGCDWVINSKSKEDACGICHGNGTECKIVQGLFSGSNITGLQPFLKLPSGASMIFIRELNHSPCYLVVSNSITSTYYLNALGSNDHMPGKFLLGTTTGVYEVKSDMERIFIRDRLNEHITFSVKCSCSKFISAPIQYQYAMPEVTPRIPTYNWHYISWQECSHPCGGGTQKAIPVCIEEIAGEVEDKYCNEKNRPEEKVRTCNKYPCVTRWWMGPWSKCNYTGEGSSTRLVLCARSPKNSDNYLKIVRENECSKQKPRTEKSCNEEKEIEYWLNRQQKTSLNILQKTKNFKKNKTRRASCQASIEGAQHDLSNDYLYDLNPYVKSNVKKLNHISNIQYKKENIDLQPKIGSKTKTSHAETIEYGNAQNYSNTWDSAVLREVINLISNNSLFNEMVKPAKKTENQTVMPKQPREKSKGEENCIKEDIKSSTTPKYTKEVVTCTTIQNLPKPVDFTSKIERGNSSSYKLLLAPKQTTKKPFIQTDIEYEYFGDSDLLTMAKEEIRKIVGEEVQEELQKARNEATEPPLIESDEK